MGNTNSNSESSQENEAGVYVMSVAAELVGTHPQTLRDYERRGLVSPKRTTGGNRRYTHSDIQKVLRIKQLRDDGMGLTAISALMEYEEAIFVLQLENDELKSVLAHTQDRLGNVENRLHEVEATIENTSKALVKYESREVLLVRSQDPKKKIGE